MHLLLYLLPIDVHVPLRGEHGVIRGLAHLWQHIDWLELHALTLELKLLQSGAWLHHYIERLVRPIHLFHVEARVVGVVDLG